MGPENSENRNETAAREQVAVYGTLMRGGSNHNLMSGARFVGRDRLKSIRLYDLGDYPGAVSGASLGIEVEVYEISSEQLALLDTLEDYRAEFPEAGLYTRKRHSTRHGEAWVYLFQGSTLGYRLILRGGWNRSEGL
ncbi:MAG: gamma-glutamylcyclotransferase [Oleiphilaceae bacterium]|nr:gamma-glutamylcyclotransferase [Oleiphilaceae bacterium]